MGLFKKKEKPLNRIHPDIKKLTREVIEIEDQGKKIKFYEFATMHDMPARRFSVLNDFIEDKRRGIEREELYEYVLGCIESIEANTVQGITDSLILLKWMKQRMQIANDVDLILRLISCALFTDDEDLTNYDWDVGTWKIELFEKHGLTAFFLSEPIKRYWTSQNLSPKDIQVLLDQRKAKAHALRELSEMVISLKNTTKGKEK